jgi:hypothetical protein
MEEDKKEDGDQAEDSKTTNDYFSTVKFSDLPLSE